MRVVLLTRNRAWQIQAANRLHREIGLCGAFFEGDLPSQDRKYDPERVAVYDAMFTDSWDSLEPSLPVGASERTGEFDPDWISSLAPDIICVFGTSILPHRMLRVAPVCLNMHFGLTPFYRGLFATNWALLRGDAQNIGVTIHILDQGIDAGPILLQERATIDADDTILSIHAKLSKLAVDGAIDVLQALNSSCLVARPQRLEAGRLYYRREWTENQARLLDSTLEDGRVGHLIASQSPELPLVRLDRRACADHVGRIHLGTLFPPEARC